MLPLAHDTPSCSLEMAHLVVDVSRLGRVKHTGRERSDAGLQRLVNALDYQTFCGPCRLEA